MSELWRFLLPGDDRTFGYLIPSTVARMPWTSEFRLDERARTIRLVPRDGTDVATSSAAAVTALLKAAQESDSFVKLFNWPGEKFAIPGAPFPFAIDRAIASRFGTLTTGAQLTVYTRDSEGSIAGIWIERAVDKATFPGLLDNAAGGAVDHGEMPFESIVREAKEEIDLDASKAKSGGTISWFTISTRRRAVNLASWSLECSMCTTSRSMTAW